MESHKWRIGGARTPDLLNAIQVALPTELIPQILRHIAVRPAFPPIAENRMVVRTATAGPTETLHLTNGPQKCQGLPAVIAVRALLSAETGLLAACGSMLACHRRPRLGRAGPPKILYQVVRHETQPETHRP